MGTGPVGPASPADDSVGTIGVPSMPPLGLLDEPAATVPCSASGRNGRKRPTQADRRKRRMAQAAEPSPGRPQAGPAGMSKQAKAKVFMEMFAGFSNLIKAVAATGTETIRLDVLDTDCNLLKEFDLLRSHDYAMVKHLIKRRRVHWLHAAPPCKTFSRARRRDQFASARILRTEAAPLGVDPPGSRPLQIREAIF